LFVVADCGVDVVMDVEAAAEVVDGVETVVFRSLVDMGHLPFEYSADGSRNIPFITLTAYG
jgi:hypothetical protein